MQDTRYDHLKHAKFQDKRQDMACGQIIVEARQYGITLLRQYPDALLDLLPEQNIVNVFSKYFIAPGLNDKTRTLNNALQLPTCDDAVDDADDDDLEMKVAASAEHDVDSALRRQFDKALSEGAVQEYLSAVEIRGQCMIRLLEYCPRLKDERILTENRFNDHPFHEVFEAYHDSRGRLISGVDRFLMREAGNAAGQYRLSFRSEDQFREFKENLYHRAFRHALKSVDSYDPNMNVKFSSFIGNQLQILLHGMAKGERTKGRNSFNESEQLSANVRDGDDRTFEDIAQIGFETDPDRGLLYEKAMNVINSMDPRYREVLIGRFVNDERLEVVGGRLGVTRERVRQIEKDALRALRHQMGVKGAKYLP